MIKLSEIIDDTDSEISYPESRLEPSIEREKEKFNHQLIDETVHFFAIGGMLAERFRSGVRPYEFRSQQLEMARAVAQNLCAGNNLCVEAPTGVGKSFAYLLPLIYRSKYAQTPALISTETINLQEQLIEKDIPILKEITNLDFKAALAKGRSNYLCRRRLSLLSGDERDKLIPDNSLLYDLEKLESHLGRDGAGEKDSLNFRIEDALWSLVCCESLNCAGPRCPFYRQCFYFAAREEWERADIIVANHALFFTDLRMKLESGEFDNSGGILPDYGALVIDEAHTLENNAAEHLGLHISHAGLRGTLNRLFNPTSARGLLMRSGDHYLRLRKAAAQLHVAIEAFFADIEELWDGEPQRDNKFLRIREPGRFDDYLSRDLAKFHQELKIAADEEDDASMNTELNSHSSKMLGYAEGLRQFINMLSPESVYYLEKQNSGAVLHASPLNVPELLQKNLFNRNFPVVLCSATLMVRHSFDYYVGRIGFTNGDALGLDSPFAAEQATVYLHRNLPEPGAENYLDTLTQLIPQYINRTDGKAFVLFTSHNTMRLCADKLRDFFLDNNFTLMVQGESLTRNMMLKAFREDVNSVIFGTDSFWTGVDVPGDALSNVIIARLPFQMPEHPLPSARCEKIKQSGGNPFADYSLPEAVLKFRQGIGRLIRSRDDRGIIAILDSRILTKSYGKLFLDALPYRIEITK